MVNQPTKEAYSIELDNRKDLNDDEFKSILSIVETLSDAQVDMQWLVDTTEKFCKDKAVYNGILNGIQIIEGKDKQHTVKQYHPSYLKHLQLHLIRMLDTTM